MSGLQKINLGTPPTGQDGDTSRVANDKMNANVDVLSSQMALTNAGAPITTAQALTAAHIGKRVNIALTEAGVINMPLASECAADQVTLLRNTGTTVATFASASGSGDTCALSGLNPGEAVLMDVDGVHAWTVLMRGRTNSDNEVVNGNFTVSGNSTVNNSTVNGNEAIGGNLSVAGGAKISGDTTLSYASGGQRGFNWAVGTSLRWRLVSDGAAETGANAGSNLTLARYTDAGAYVDNPLIVNRATGAFAFGQRPTFNGNAPWDAANFNPGLYALLASPSLSGTPTVNGLAWTGSQFSVRNSAATPWAVSAYCSAQVGGCFIGRTDAASVPLAAWFFGTSNVGTITTNGSTTTYGTGSDYRLKDGIEDLDGDFAVDLLMQGRPRKFWMRADPAKRVNYGFIAHEYAEIQPEAVVGEKDGMGPPMAPPVDDEGNAVDMPEEPRYQHMDYSKPTPILWAALKRAIERISALEAELVKAGPQ